MRSVRDRSGALWAGAALSGLAHAALVGLALVAPPWLRAHRERPVPVVTVALVTPAAFEAALAALTRPDPAPAAKAPPVPTVPEPPAAAPPVEAAPEAGETGAATPEGALPTLAPAFDPESPLGLGPKPAADLPAHRPRARPGIGLPTGSPAAASATRAEAVAAFEAAVRAAVLEAQAAAAPARGPGGAVRLAVVVNREGRLLAARLVGSSGSAAVDRAAVEAARTALLPEVPEAMPNPRVTVPVDLVFAPGGG
jgi:protein TonB